MTGIVDPFGRALVEIQIAPDEFKPSSSLCAWIDTAFTGELAVPAKLIEQLQLPKSAVIDASLADGHSVTLSTHSCVIDWFDEQRAIEVISSQGEFALLGVGLLIGRTLTIDYSQLTLHID